MNKKKIIIIVSSILGAILLLVAGFLIGKNLNNKKADPKETFVATGTIIAKQDNNYIIQDEETLELYSITTANDEYELGDIIEIYTKTGINESYPAQVDASKVVLVEKYEAPKTGSPSIDMDDTEINSNPNKNNSNSNNSNKNNNSSNNNSSGNNTTTPTPPPAAPKTEEDVVKYFNTLDANLSQANTNSSFTASIKSGFVTIVDFLFYGGKIYGYTFKELGESAKLTVLKVALSIDSKIEKVLPGYKETLSNAYKSVKAKVITAYLDLTVKICNTQTDKWDGPDICAQAKKDFGDLKNNFGLTWSFITDLAGSAIGKLSDWYLIWRDI